MQGGFMVVSSLNDYVWAELCKDAAFSAKYNKYRTKYGQNFKPFFPVHDNFTGDVSWDTECYVLYDEMDGRPLRQVYRENHDQVIYTLVGPIPDLLDFKKRITRLFSHWDTTKFTTDEFRINDVDVWQADRTRGRDTLRQTYSLTLMLDVNYHICE
jgi:hypothetical protein